MTRSSPKLVLLREGTESRDRAAEPPHALGLREALGLHLDALYRTARVLAASDAAAEDLVQETALRASRAWDGLRHPRAVKSWLLRILHRAFLNTRRDATRRPQLVDLDLDALLSDPLLESPAPALDEGSLSDEVALALDALPSGFREAVWLVDVEELKMAEAAEVLDLPLGTVASRVHRARRLLREMLADGGRGGRR